MTRGPRRLLDDPDFKWETGCDLADERLALGQPDLSGLRQRILAQVPAGPTVGDGVPPVRPFSPWTPWVRPFAGLASVAAVMGVGGYYFGTAEAPAPTAPPVSVHSWSPPSVSSPEPDTVVVVPGPEPAPPEPVHWGAPPPTAPQPVHWGAPPPTAPQPVHWGAPPPTAPPESVHGGAPPSTAPQPVHGGAPPATESVDRKVSSPVLPVAPPGPIDARFAGSAAAKAQIEEYDRAREAHAQGRHEEAVRRFDALRKVPNGLFVPEASLYQLLSLLALEDAQGTLALIDTIEDEPALSAKRDDLGRLRAESLVMLGRCEDALAVSESLSPKSASEIRRACRQRKGTPP